LLPALERYGPWDIREHNVITDTPRQKYRVGVLRPRGIEASETQAG